MNSVELADILITPELRSRNGRRPDFVAEAEVLRSLGERMAERPEEVLPALVESVLRLCSGDSAGVNLVDREHGRVLLRTIECRGVCGEIGKEPVEAEDWPCGFAVEAGEAQLFRNPGRRFLPLKRIEPEVAEILTVPLVGADAVVGTVWLASHGKERRLDAEDLRILSGLAGFFITAMRQSGMFRDLAAARREARELGQRLGILLESISDGLAFLDEQRRFLFANEKCLNLLRKADTEVVGFRADEVFPPDCAEELRRLLGAATAENRHQVLECRLGDLSRMLEVDIYPAASGGVCLLVTDVSDQRRMELERTQLLRRTQRHAGKLKELAEAARGIGSAESLAATLQEIADHAASIIGTRRAVTEIAVGDQYQAPIRAEFRAAEIWEKAAEAAGPELRVPLFRKSGGRLGQICLSGKVDGSFTLDDESILIQLAHMASAAAEKAWAEEALRENRQRLEIAVEASGFGIFEMNLGDGRFTGTAIFRDVLRLGEDLGARVSTLMERIHPEDRADVRAAFRRALRKEERYVVECRYLWPGGEWRWMAVFGRILNDRNRRPARVIGVVSDVTSRKQIEEELRSVNQTLEQRVEKRTAVANRRAEQLRALALELTRAEQRERRRIAQVLHDHLQQILVAAKLRLGMIRENSPEEAQKESVAQTADLLSRAIEASRDLTVELSPPILFDGGLAAGLDWLSRRMKEEQRLDVRVKAEGAEELDGYLKAFLFQATRELLFNVVKHAGVSEAKVELDARNDGEVRIQVTDRGKGFVPSEMVKEAKGGFGLASVRERLDLLGGRIDIQSRPGKGTIVTLIAPRTKAVEEDAAARDLLSFLAPERGKPGKAVGVEESQTELALRVLLADDHKILREGLVGLLTEQPGVRVVGEASDGQMAVDLALREKPDVIIMDITMPRMNGIEATRQIVAQWPEAVVIGLSMHDKEDMATAMIEAGAKAYVTKGAPSEILIETVWAHAPFCRIRTG